MHIKEFILSKIFRKHLLIALVLTIFLLWLTMLVLSFYTHRGESIALPDFSGMTIEQAQKSNPRLHLKFEVENSVFKADRPVGSILMQNPVPGHKIKSGRTVYLTLVSSTPDLVEVPKLTDISLRQAKVLLESKGFSLGRVEFIPSEFNDLVLDQKNKGVTIVPGSKLYNNTSIDLVVGKNGAVAETVVPDLTGKTLDEVKEVILNNQLQTGSVVFDASVTSLSDSLAARVINQSPQADSTVFVPAGSAVNFVFSIQPPK